MNIFHNTVPQSERSRLECSDLFRPTLKICADHSLLVSSVDVDTTCDLRVRFITDATKRDKYDCYAPIMVLRRSNDLFYMSTYDDLSGAQSHIGEITHIETRNAMYIAKALQKGTKAGKALDHMKIEGRFLTVKLLHRLSHSARRTFADGRDTRVNYHSHISNDMLSRLFRVLTGEQTTSELSLTDQSAITAIRNERDKYQKVSDEISLAMADVFSGNKWFVTFLPFVGYTVQQVDLSKTWKSLSSNGLITSFKDVYVDVMPITLYRHLEDIPSDIKDQLLGALTFAKMHIVSKFSEVASLYGGDDGLMLHLKRPIVSSELSTLVESFGERRTILLPV